MSESPRFTAIGKATESDTYLIVDVAHDPKNLELGTPTRQFDVDEERVSAAVPLGSWLKFSHGNGYEETTLSDGELTTLLHGASFEEEGGFAIRKWRNC